VASPLFLFAQKAKKDTLERSYIPTGIRVGTDLVSLIRSQTDDSFRGYEFTADVDFYRYFFTAEAGHWERHVKNQEDDYSNKGDYLRVGADVNFLKNDPDGNMFFFGARYGQSKFSENLSITTEDLVWGRATQAYNNTDLTGRWGELVTGLRVKMWKFFWMGYTARYKFGLSTDTPQGFEVYDVPGFGRTFKNTTWGFNYQIFIRIPVRKTGKSKSSEAIPDAVE
jgi:hypothetical protein